MKKIKKGLSLLLSFFIATFFSLSASADTDYYKKGDVNNDYIVSAEDARLALRYCVSLENDDSLKASYGKDYDLFHALDADKDNSVTSADARMILRMSIGLINDKKEYSMDKTAADRICKQYRAMNVQAAVIEDGKVIATYNYGYRDKANNLPTVDNSKIRCASLSKLMTFAVCMALYDEGIVDIDADISEYMGYKVRNPSYPNTPITLRKLMTHTASIRDGNTFNNSLTSVSSVPMKTLLTGTSNYYSWINPGKYTVYSNFGAAIVGSVCEMATGKCFEDLAQQYVIEPLGIDAGYRVSSIEERVFTKIYSGTSESWGYSRYNNCRYNSVIGQTCHVVQGNLFISAKDYATLMAMLLNGGMAENGTRVLSQQSVNEMLKVQFTSETEKVGFGTYAINNLFKGITSYTHTGSAYGFYGSYAMDKEYKNGVVVMTSGCSYSLNESTKLYNVCQALIIELMPEFE